MQTEKLNAIKGAIKDGKMVQAAGGITVTQEQSDKLGYDWKVYTVNDVAVRKEYVAQEHPHRHEGQSHRLRRGRAAHQQRLLPKGRENLRLDGRVGCVGIRRRKGAGYG